jgi:phosphoserine phosphatase
MDQQRPKFDAVCFDCDSTLSRIEGIDELAARSGLGREIAALTEAAMNGSLAIDAVYGKRLAAVRPDKAAVAWLGQRYVEELVPGAKETVDALHRLGKAVYIVSGGLLPAIRHLSLSLGIPAARVFAVPIHFDASGGYQGFDETSPLSRAEGKAMVCRRLAAQHASVAMVGDGMTDVAARAACAYVVGFGGVAHREAVAREADRYITGSALTATLEALLSADERDALARHSMRRR